MEDSTLAAEERLERLTAMLSESLAINGVFNSIMKDADDFICDAVSDECGQNGAINKIIRNAGHGDSLATGQRLEKFRLHLIGKFVESRETDLNEFYFGE